MTMTSTDVGVYSADMDAVVPSGVFRYLYVKEGAGVAEIFSLGLTNFFSLMIDFLFITIFLHFLREGA